MFQNLFLSVSNAETLYYFYYFFEKSRATVAHFFSTVISLFLPTASTFFGRVVQAPRAQTTRPHHEKNCIYFHFRRCSVLNAKKDVAFWERVHVFFCFFYSLTIHNTLRIRIIRYSILAYVFFVFYCDTPYCGIEIPLLRC